MDPQGVKISDLKLGEPVHWISGDAHFDRGIGFGRHQIDAMKTLLADELCKPPRTPGDWRLRICLHSGRGLVACPAVSAHESKPSDLHSPRERECPVKNCSRTFFAPLLTISL